MVYLYCGMLVRNEKKLSTDAYYNMEGHHKTHQVKEVRYKRLHIVRFYLYEMFRKGKLIQTESRSMVAYGWGECRD